MCIRDRYSIIIPVYNQLEWTQRCIASIRKYTKETHEIIVISNGSTDGTNEWLTTQDLIYETHPEPLGYAKAINQGLKLAKGEYIILLNNDTEIIDQRDENHTAQDPHDWIKIMREMFDADPDVGIAGPLSQMSDVTKRNFIIFFCVMLNRKVLAKVGPLDEDFGAGAGEDTLYCYLAEEAGFKVVKTKKILPIYHAAEITMHAAFGKEEWGKMFYANKEILRRKYEERINNPKVTVIIPTKDRYSQLAQLLAALWRQTYTNFYVIIVDDSENPEEITKRDDTLLSLIHI